MIKGISISPDSHDISILQYADNILLFLAKSIESLKKLGAIVTLFGISSGSKIIYSKTTMILINVNDEWMRLPARILGCQLGKLQFKYMGVPIGCDMQRIKN